MCAYVCSFVGRNNSVGIATRYGLAGRSGDRIPVVAKFSTPVQNGPGARAASRKVDKSLFPRGLSRRHVALTTDPYLAPRLQKE